MALVREKGQVSIEFILIVAIALIYINMYVWPSIESSSQSAVDIKSVADTKISAMRLANALNEAAGSSGDVKKTINIYLPENAKLFCITQPVNEASVDYNVMVSYMEWNPDELHCVEQDDPIDPVANPPIGFMCNSSIDLLSSAATQLNSGGGCPQNMDLPGLRQLVVEKTGTTISVNWKA